MLKGFQHDPKKVGLGYNPEEWSISGLRLLLKGPRILRTRCLKTSHELDLSLALFHCLPYKNKKERNTQGVPER